MHPVFSGIMIDWLEYAHELAEKGEHAVRRELVEKGEHVVRKELVEKGGGEHAVRKHTVTITTRYCVGSFERRIQSAWRL